MGHETRKTSGGNKIMEYENMNFPKTDKEHLAYKLGIDVGQIKQDILAVDLEGLNEQCHRWEAIEPMIDPTSYMKHSDEVHRLHEVVRILLKAKSDLKKLDQ